MDTQGGSFATRRPVGVLMIFAAAVVFGYFSIARLPLTLMPELTYPTLTVRTEYAGAAPEEVENDISRPVEEALGVIGGLKKLESVSRPGVSDVLLEFAWDTDMTDAVQDVLERLDLVSLPPEAGRPLILHFDPSLDPVMELSLSGSGEAYRGEPGQRKLRRLAELQVKRALEPVPGVAAVRVRGGLEEEIHVLLDEAQLRRTGIAIQRVLDRLSEENINVAGGTLRDGRMEYLVRTLNEYRDLEEIADTVVASVGGRDVRVRDLGEVRRTHRDREMATRVAGQESVRIEIYKEGDANLVALAGRLREVVGTPPEPSETGGPPAGPKGDDTLAARLGRDEDARLEVVADRSVFIGNSLRQVRDTAMIGGLLAMGVLLVFMGNPRSTAIVAASIPISILMTFAPMHLMGVSLNMMSLGGLALGIGMLVDSSIVVLESIFRCREEGDALEPAAVRGTREVRGAVAASTLTSIAVFFPMVFVEGVAGQAFGDLGIAVVVSLLASLAVAVFFIPMLASLGGRGEPGPGTRPPAVRLRRWVAWEVFRGSLRGARSLWRWAMARPEDATSAVRRFVTRLARPPKIAAAALGVLAVWAYALGRLGVGTVLEWALAKPLWVLARGLVLAFRRGVAPGVRGALAPLVRPLLALTGKGLGSLQTAYPKALGATLAHPVPVILVLGLCLWGTLKVFGSLDSELLPEVHQGEFTVEAGLPVGTPLEETVRRLSMVERRILDEVAGVRGVAVTYGYDPEDSRRPDEGEHTANFKVLMEPSDRPAALENRIVGQVRRIFAGVPDVTTRIVRPVLFSSRTPVEVEIHGDDLARLREYADRAASVLSGLPELADVRSTLRPGAPEMQLFYDRDRLAAYGLNVAEVAALVRDKVKGSEATRLNLRDRRVPVVVRLQEPDRRSVEDVADLVVNPGAPRPVRLSSVAEIRLGEGPSEVRRVDGRRVAVIQAGLGDASLSEAVAAIRHALGREVVWPPDMTFYISGQQEEWDRSRRSLWFALGLSVFLVYVIMAVQFESLVHPLVIMFSIPLAFVGSAVALKLSGVSLSIVVFLGMIMLAGIVVNNAIVLVDYVNRLRRRGRSCREALVEAGAVRLRPILMTTATTVLGLAPLAWGLGDGAELRAPMALTVIAGLLSSTVLTLFAIPTLYLLADRGLALLPGRSRESASIEVAPPAGVREAPPEAPWR